MLIPMRQCVELVRREISGVVHIGACRGEEAKDYVENQVQRVLWVEANKALMKHLYDNCKMLPLTCEYLCYALSDKDGELLRFNITNNEQSSSILPLGTHGQHYPHIQVVRTEELMSRRFDTVVSAHIARIDLDQYQMVNIDVQGAELKVLKGFGHIFNTHPSLSVVYAEVNEEPLYEGCCLVEELDDFLSTFGFRRIATSMTPQKWGDAIYVR